LDGLAGFVAKATDYELFSELSESMIEAAMVHLMLKRLAA
jgi:hypothetical protein